MRVYLSGGTGFAFHSPVTRRTKGGQNEGAKRGNHGMLMDNDSRNGTRADIEIFNEATHEKAGWNLADSMRVRDGAIRLHVQERGAVLRVWMPVHGEIGRSASTERDEGTERSGHRVERRGEWNGGERKAARIRGVSEEFAAVASRGSGSGDDGGAGVGDSGANVFVEREVSAYPARARFLEGLPACISVVRNFK